MKKHQIIFWVIQFLGFSLLNAQDSIPAPVVDDPFAGWSDERFEAYEDSLFKVLYPRAEIRYFDENYNSDDNSFEVSKIMSYSSLPTVSIDKSKAVGEIGITSGVTPTGARTYNIPIDLYPGINGFAPSLSLAYNSQQSTSIMGQGWSLAGLSSIMRVSKTIYHDGKVEAIKMDFNDSFVLNGVRLVRQTSGSDYINYETEQGNIKARAYHNDSIFTYFEVFYPDGLKGIFGFPEKLRKHTYYPITSLTDKRGNSILFDYTLSFNHYYINKITYNNDCTVEFKYDSNRPDPRCYRNGGIVVRLRNLLKNITCKLGSTVIGEYSLTYETRYGKSLLTEVAYSVGTKSFNPLKFYYGDGVKETGYNAVSTKITKSFHPTTANSVRIGKGRFDFKNGTEGIFTFRNYTPYWKHYRNSTALRHSQNRFINMYEADEEIFVYNNLAGDNADEFSILAEDGFIDIVCADIRGNRQDCIIKINNIVSGNYDLVKFNIYESFANGLQKMLTRSFSFPTVFTDGDGGKSIQPKFYYPGDFDGDGKMEILAISAHHALGDKSPASKIYIFDLIENKIKYEKEVFNFSLDFVGTTQSDMEAVERNSDKLFVHDCDGDGKTDICWMNSTGLHSYTFEKDNNGALVLKHLMSTNNPPGVVMREMRWLSCDHDGDGLLDLISPPDGSSSSWTYAMATGNGGYGYSSFNYNFALWAEKTDSHIIADLNNDGFSDVVCLNRDQTDNATICAYISNGSSFFEAYHLFPTVSGLLIAPVSVNSRTQHFPIIALKDNTISRYSFSRNETIDLAVTAMVSSLGVVHSNVYEVLSKESSNYSYNMSSAYPFANICEPISVLVSNSTSVNGEIVDSQKFKYKNGILHLQGLGFCGFESITTENQRGQIATDTYDPLNYCVLTSRVTPVSKANYTYSVSHNPQGLTKVLLSNKTENNLLEGTESTTSYEYDQYGYPTKELTNIKNYGTITKSIAYDSDPTIGDWYFLGLPESETTVITNSTGSYSESTHTLYEQMLPIDKTWYIGGQQTKYEEYLYDNSGNLVEFSVTPYSSYNTLTTTYEYDLYGRVTKTTDPLGLSEEETYNASGYRIRHKDIRGNITTYNYDDFGRIESQTAPDGTKTSVEYAWTTATPGCYTLTTVSTGSPSERETYDALGRVVENATMSFDGSWLKVFKEYDKYGNLSRSSLPTKKANALLWDTYAYDSNDRLLSVTEASGKISTTSYNKLDVTTVSDGVETIRHFNSKGEIIQIEDPEGTTEYSYDPDGQLSTVVTPDGEETKFLYDSVRRRISVTDPNSDTVEWTYDDDGNIVSEVIGGVYVTNSEYDSFGRLTSVSIGGDSHSYTYNQYGEVGSVSVNGSTAKTISYDSYGRISSMKEYASPQVWLQSDYTYSNGNVSSLKYTSDLGNIATENFTYSNGHLSEIKLNNATSVYKLVSENDLGITSEIKTGGLTRTYGFTSAGFPSKRTVNYGNTKIQDFAYTFDASTSNLKNRKDLVCSKSEDFAYDEINRLKSWGNNSAGYDIMGNVTSRSDVGTFGYYIADKPYAVSQVQLSSSAIPLHKQSISYFTNGLPSSITENGISTEFNYGYDRQRNSMTVKQNGKEILKRYYIGGCYEREQESGSDLCERLYLGGGYYDAVGVLQKSGSTDNTYYLLRDYLGSVRQICKSDGTLVQELDYDPWGGVSLSDRTPVTSTAISAIPLFGRGFTGHEHLSWHGLINMNARLYDPALCRFLSPDPLVQAPWDPQNFNRFTYALNNPLHYIDEDGEFILTALLIGAAVGGIINVATHWDQIKSAGGGWSSFWKGAGYFAIGGAAGAAGTAAGIAVATIGAGGIAAATSATYAAASMGFVPGAMSGMAGGAANGFVLGFGNATLEGSSIGSAFGAVGLETLSGAITGGITGGIAGGISAASAGRNFWSGKAPAPNITSHMNASIKELNLPTYGESTSEGTYTVYFGRDKVTGEVKYVGMTGRDPEIRFKEHLRSKTQRATLYYEPVTEIGTLTRMDARIMEQKYINEFGLENLLNKRNEIAPKYWLKYNIRPGEAPNHIVILPFIKEQKPFKNIKN